MRLRIPPVPLAALLVVLSAWGPAAAGAAPARAYVSASARDRDGDGTRAHPFPSVEAALRSGARTVVVAAGRYPERVELRPGQTLQGEAGSVIEGGGEGPVLIATGGTVKGLTLRARAGPGVRIQGRVQFDQVEVRVEGRIGVAVERGALSWRGGALRGGASAGTGLALSSGARARLSGVSVQGPFRIGVTADHGRLELSQVTLQGCAIGVRLRGDRARLSQVRIERGAEVGVFVGEGALDAERLSVSGHEYGLLAGKGARLTLRRLTLEGNRRAGLAAQNATVSLAGSVISKSGAFGGVQLTGSNGYLERVRVLESQGEGVVVIGGEATLRQVTVDRVADPTGAEGEGILVRRGRARLEEVSVSNVSGLGLYAAEGGVVDFGRLSLSACAAGALVAEGGAAVRGDTLRLSHQAPRLVATRKGRLQVEKLQVDPPGALELHCEADARVRLGTLVGTSAPELDCLSVSGR